MMHLLMVLGVDDDPLVWFRCDLGDLLFGEIPVEDMKRVTYPDERSPVWINE